MSIDIAQLSAHLAPEQQGQVKKAYQRAAKHDTTAFLLCFFLGLFGAHRFYLNQMGSGLAHLGLTVVGIAALVGGFFTQQPINYVLYGVGALLLLIGLIWEARDLFAIDNQIHERNLALAERLIASAALADPSVLNQASAQLDRVVRETAARSAVPAGTGAISDADVASARAMADAGDEGEPTASAKYVSMSRMQLSDDPANLPSDERQLGPGDPANNWTNSQTTFGQLPAEEAGAAAPGFGAGATLNESVIHAHEEGGYRSTDSYEVDRSITPNAATALEAPSLEDAYTMPATTEATPSDEIAMDASTWPDYPPVPPVEETRAAEPSPEPWPAVTSYEPDYSAADSEPSLTDDMLLGGAALGAGALGLGALASTSSEATPETPSVAAPQYDVTDAPTSSFAAPVADVAHPGAEPVHVTLPEASPVFAREAVEMAPLYLAPEEPATLPSMPFAASEPEYTPSGWGTYEEPPTPQEYVPPTVPMEDTAPFAASAGVYEAMNAPIQPITLPTDWGTESAPQTDDSSDSRDSGETLAELAGFAGLAGAGALAAEPLTHSEPTPEPAAAPLVSEPVAFEQPTPAPEPPAPTPPADPNLIVGEGGQLMKRVRVKRRLVVDGEVISEEVREEIVPVDMDTATAAAQLQASLGQATAEEIAQKAHLAPDEIELHRRTEGGTENANG